MTGQPRPRPWHCDPLTPVCISGHPFITLRENQHEQAIEYAGFTHVYYTCRKCEQAAFGIQTEWPSPLLTLYACSPEELEHIRTDMRSSAATSLDILSYLGYANGRSRREKGSA